MKCTTTFNHGSDTKIQYFLKVGLVKDSETSKWKINTMIQGGAPDQLGVNFFQDMK